MYLIVDTLAYPEPAVMEAAIRRAVREQGVTRYALFYNSNIPTVAWVTRSGAAVLTTPDRRPLWEPVLDPTCDVAVWVGERLGLPRAKARELVKKGLETVAARSKKYAEYAKDIMTFLNVWSVAPDMVPDWQDIPADWFPASAPAVEKDYQLLEHWDTSAVAAAHNMLIHAVGVVGLDFETEGDYPFMQPVGFSVSWAPGQAVYSPIDTSFGLSDAQRAFLTAVVARPWVAHNAVFELHCLETLGVPVVETSHDTMVIAWEHGYIREGLGLKALMAALFGERPTTFEEAAKGRKWSEVPLDEATPYACADADNCRRLFYELTENRRAATPQHGVGGQPMPGPWQNEHLYNTIDRPLVPVLQQMERRGVTLDSAWLADWDEHLEDRLAALEAVIFREIGFDLNLNSPKQVSALLFDHLGLDPARFTATGYSTDDDTLRQLAGQHPVIPLLLEHREVSKQKSTYGRPMRRFAEVWGRLHFGWDGTGAETGRMSSKGPEWHHAGQRIKGPQGQNIPLVARRAIVAAPGRKLVAVDYSQIELRILAHMSQDPVFLAAFREGRNPHVETMAALFGVSDKLAEGGKFYRISKEYNFGIPYGIGPETIVDKLRAAGVIVTPDEVKAQLRDHQKLYHVTWDYRAAHIRTIRSRGFAETLHGRRVYYSDLNSPDPEKRAAAEREAFNEEIQGTAGDFTKAAAVAWSAEGFDRLWPLILLVHDESVTESPADEAEQCLAALTETMIKAAQPYLSLAVEVAGGIADNWAALKG